jgi:hypothetical protein
VDLSDATRGRCGRWHAQLSEEIDLARVGRLAEALERTLKDGHLIDRPPSTCDHCGHGDPASAVQAPLFRMRARRAAVRRPG